jgi:hypothetical protein
MPSNLRKIFTEPLFQFFVAALALYFLVQFIQSKKDRDARQIIVDSPRVAQMVLNYKTQTGSLPSKATLDALIDQYIKEEVLYREAKKMGLDQDDEIIRRRLVQKFNFLRGDQEPMPNPADSSLERYWREHPEQFRTSPSVSFTHVYFSNADGQDSTAVGKARSVLMNIHETDLDHAKEKGDRFPLQNAYTEQTLLELRQNFGDSPFSDTLFKIPLNTWTGPIRSGYGWHLVYASARSSGAILPFSTAKEEVRDSYLASFREEKDRQRMTDLEKRYTIRRDYLDEK